MSFFAKPTKKRKDFTKPRKEKSISVRQREEIAPDIMAEALMNVVRFVLLRVPIDKVEKRKARIRSKIMELNTHKLSTTNLPEAASIGQVLTIIKNMLFGKSSGYINNVRAELLKRLM